MGSDAQMMMQKIGLLRIGAKMIDFFVFFLVLAFLPYPFGSLLGLSYSLLADGLQWKTFQGQSLGKKLLHLQVKSIQTHQPIGWQQSVLRNLPVGVATFFSIIPIWGWFILIFVGLPLMVVEIYLMMRVTQGQRLGDLLGDTEVVEL